MSTEAATSAAPAERAWVLSDEPLPVRLMSTIWAAADGTHDDLRTTADVDAWLDAVGVDRAGEHATESELGRARALRDAVRRLAAYLTARRAISDNRCRDGSRPAERDGSGVARSLSHAARRPP